MFLGTKPSTKGYILFDLQTGRLLSQEMLFSMNIYFPILPPTVRYPHHLRTELITTQSLLISFYLILFHDKSLLQTFHITLLNLLPSLFWLITLLFCLITIQPIQTAQKFHHLTPQTFHLLEGQSGRRVLQHTLKIFTVTL